MLRGFIAVAVMLAAALFITLPTPHRRVLQLPAGILHLYGSWAIGNGVEVLGSPRGTTLRMEPNFDGEAALTVGSDVYLHDFTIEGDRAIFPDHSGLPPYDVPFRRFSTGNGVLADGATGIRIDNLHFREMAGFAILLSRSHDISLYRVTVADSGSRNPAGRNNSTGGILLEEGTTDFRVTQCEFRHILGNGLWTHSLYTSPRNLRGVMARNVFDEVGRDAIQVGHASDIRVEENVGRAIGFPIDAVDIENRAIPVGVDTAGNVEHSSYLGNHFEEIDGKCMDLDGFHDGEIRGNTCINRGAPESYRFGNYGIVMNNSNPDMQSRNIRIIENVIDGPLFGGIFVIGSGNVIARNRLLNMNRAHCNEEAARFGCYYAPGEPDMLRTAIYLGKGAERPAPAHGNIIEQNEISGFKMKTRCIAHAPGIADTANTLRENTCSDK